MGLLSVNYGRLQPLLAVHTHTKWDIFTRKFSASDSYGGRARHDSAFPYEDMTWMKLKLSTTEADVKGTIFVCGLMHLSLQCH